MNELDQFIKQTLREKYYIRYTDDFVIVHHDRNHLIELKYKLEQFLSEVLKLQLHPDKVEIRKYSQGIDFLGYVAMPNARELRTRTKRRIVRKLDGKLRALKNESISEESFLQTFASYLGVIKHANTHRFEERLKHKIWESIKNLEDKTR
jgi:RNA-directed DNA polymerase